MKIDETKIMENIFYFKLSCCVCIWNFYANLRFCVFAFLRFCVFCIYAFLPFEFYAYLKQVPSMNGFVLPTFESSMMHFIQSMYLETCKEIKSLTLRNTKYLLLNLFVLHILALLN